VVLLNLIPKNQIYYKLDKTLKFATIKIQHILGNYEDFDMVVTVLWAKVRVEQYVGICGAQSQRP